MILTIQQYIEALTNSEGRFRTLERVYPVAGDEGTPVFAVPGNGLVDFEVFAGEKRLTLRCPLLNSAADRIRIRAMAAVDEGLGSEFYTGWQLLESEISLFEWTGEAVEADILCRPATPGLPVAEFLQNASFAGNVPLILKALGSFSRLAEWFRNIDREGVPSCNLRFTADGGARLTGFSARCEMSGVALALFFAAVMPDAYAVTVRPLLVRSPSSASLAVRLCAAAAELGITQPELVLAGDLGESLARLAAYTPAQAAALGARLSVMLSCADDSAKAHSVQENDEDLICVRDNDGWKYLDSSNRQVIEGRWLDALPFREGRAVVETDRGRGLIDREGCCILEPVYEEVVWDEYWGLVSVMLEGRWTLLDRDGVLLTETGYDWLGECSEGFVLSQKEGKCGFLDTQGREVIPFEFDDATSFFEGNALVTVGKESFLIGPDGVRRPST